MNYYGKNNLEYKRENFIISFDSKKGIIFLKNGAIPMGKSYRDKRKNFKKI